MLETKGTSFLDVLRGSYVRLPASVRSTVAPLLALLPADMRWGSTYRQYRVNIARSEVDADFVAAYQLRQIRTLVRLCSHNSHYRSIFHEAFGRKWESRSFNASDLQNLPVLTKVVLRDAPEALLVKPISQVDTVSTSGTSGRPFTFYLDRDRGAKEWAFHHHVWGRIGYRLTHKRAVLRGIFIPNVDTKPWAYDAALRELQLSPFHLTPDIMDGYLKQISARGIHFLHGYPSAISILARHALRTGWKPPATLGGIIAISEPLFVHQRELMQKAFPGVTITAPYGLSEKVAYASEALDLPGHYDFEPLYGYTELVDDQGTPVTEPGRTGRIVATGFLSQGMPLLRYDTGDVATLVRLPNPENIYRLRVRSIRPRRGQEFLVGRNNALISIAAINIHSPIYARIREFQFFQDTPGEAQIRVVPADGYGQKDLEPIIDEIQRKIGTTIKFRLVLSEAIGANTRGKKLFIDQRLDVGRYTC